MARTLDRKAQVELQLAEATAALLDSLETGSQTKLIRAFRAVRFAQKVHQGKASERRHSEGAWNGLERRGAVMA